MKKSRVVSLLLALVLCLGLATPAFAVEGDFTVKDGVLTKYNGPGGDVTIPDGVTEIGRYAFYACNDLTSVTIPDGVTSIAPSAFRDCGSLTGVTIPDSVESIGYDAFEGTPWLDNAGDYVIASHILLRYQGTDPNVVIPDDVTQINFNAFINFDPEHVVKSVVFPEGLTAIPDGLFEVFMELTDVTIPESVTYLGSAAFSQCYSLSEIKLPKGITFIGDYTFWRSWLHEIEIPDGVTAIGNFAFGECPLTTVTIPASVTTMNANAFDDCPLTDMTILNGDTEITGVGFLKLDRETDEAVRMDVTVHAPAGGKVEAYCKENGIAFVALENTSATEPATRVVDPAVGLTAIRDFADSGLSDVPQDWSRDYIITCYELGLMSGQGGGIFNPIGRVSVAEGVAVAARIYDLWRGGSGDIPLGDPWYTGAVNYCLEHGIISEGEFTDYLAPATRAQLAGILARVLPEENYTALNNITTLPDVNSSTPYSQGIFKLYNAGVLSGNDEYGTFSPNAYISRSELAALLCRLVKPATRTKLNLQEKPAAPAMAYTSDKLLWAGNVPLAGVVMIEGEYYLSMEVLDLNRLSYQVPFGFSGTSDTSEYYYMFRGNASKSSEPITLMKPVITVQAGQEIGETVAATKPLSINGEIIENAVRTLDGRYPMVRLSALPESFGYRDEGDRLVICGDAANDVTITWEENLAGQALASLAKGSPRATAQAIHDYLVNTLTHTDGMDGSYWKKNDPNRHARGEELQEQYYFSNNYHLAWGYGVCQDYAELFQSMCIQAGIPCQLVTGEPNHAWNRVYIDGSWLYVDVTWDDPTGSSPTLLQEYFLVDAEKMAVKHYWDDGDFPMPQEYDPAWEQLDPHNITSADMFRKCLVAQLMQQKTSFSLKVTASGAYGGTGCMYAYQSGWNRTYYTSWSSMRCQYNSQTKSYDFTVSYW